MKRKVKVKWRRERERETKREITKERANLLVWLKDREKKVILGAF